MKKEIINELERMANDKKGILLICAFPDCKKMQVKTEDEIFWLSRNENPEIYDRVLNNYKSRWGLDDMCISHGYCQTCYERELKKLQG